MSDTNRIKEERDSALAMVRQLQDERTDFGRRAIAAIRGAEDVHAAMVRAVVLTIPERYRPEVLTPETLSKALNRWAQDWHIPSVLVDVMEERRRQDARWGEQNHPDGTGGIGRREVARRHREACDEATCFGRVTWRDILQEEVSEAFAEDDPAKLRKELIQVAAVAVAWVEAIDRRGDR